MRLSSVTMAAVSPAAASSVKSSGSSCSPLERSRVVAFARSNAASKASFSSSFVRTSSLFRPYLASRPSLIIRLSCGASGLNSGGGLWEDSDDGDGSQLGKMNDVECDDEEEENLPIGEEERNSSSYDGLDFLSEDERLQHEVHLLLNPEERAILEQNETPSLSKISSNKWRPFSTRALSGQIPFMGVLLQNGLNIDAIDKDGLTALHWAVIGKKEAVISHLLRRGANPHLRDMDGATPLHYAVQVGAIQTVKLLIKYKVDVNAADHEGWTPLHLAVQSRSRDIAKVLLVNGADKNRKNKDGKTPLDLSLCYGKDFKSYELAKLIKLVPANRELGPQF